MKRCHMMPFGAELQTDGRVRFRLWAPGTSGVELSLHDGAEPEHVPMQALAGGWFELLTDRAGAGSLYGFRLDGGDTVPDPAARFQPSGVHGPSEVIDPGEYDWRDGHWRGRPWEEVVLYELHVGTFSDGGDFGGVAARLDYLVDLGVTALELMPVSEFAGARNWGYDGVLPFAPSASYGDPIQLKALVQAAHERGLMVFLDVVYNHFGPEGNYLHRYAPDFFTSRHSTPWGDAINFDGPGSRAVRDFFIHNALYWLEEYHLDGLRLDAVHAIADDSQPHVLVELAERVRAGPGAGRHVHLVLENDDNAARYLVRDAGGRARWYDAQWNDDLHHCLGVMLTGDRDGYYADYTDDPAAHLARCLTEGFAFQGEPSAYRGGRRRGEPSGDLPPAAFVSFMQNHDQVGNRGMGERIDALAPPEAVRAAAALRLLAPSPPLLFMGEEFAASTPFLYFCDYHGELADAVREGRRREFSRFERFADPAAREHIPDPNREDTFLASRVDWDEADLGRHGERLAQYRHLLGLRWQLIVPRLGGGGRIPAASTRLGERAFEVRWQLPDGARLTLLANLAGTAVHTAQALGADARPQAQLICAEPAGTAAALAEGRLPAWGVAWFLEVDE